MAAPSSYTEKTLADYMHSELGKVATLLAYAVGVADAGSYQEAVNSTLLAYDAATIDLAVDIKKLRALSRVEVWRKALNDLATYYKFSSTGTAFERSTVYRQANENLNRALNLAAEWIPYTSYEIGVTRVTSVNDPYQYIPYDESTL